jgi:hypothetical protein
MGKGRGSITVGKSEQTNRSQLMLDVNCASNGTLLTKVCDAIGNNTRRYQPLKVGDGLAYDVDGLGDITLTTAGFLNITGTLVVDDGANWRLTLEFVDGVVIDIQTGASVAATCTWTPV